MSVEIRLCGKCGPQPVENFAWRNKAKGTKQTWCKSCQKVYKDSHYKQNKAAYIAKSHDSRKTGFQWLWALLCRSECADCELTDPVVLEFDHVRGVKIANVTQLVAQQASRQRVEEEISKCEIVCANCHKRRTYERCGSYRLGPIV